MVGAGVGGIEAGHSGYEMLLMMMGELLGVEESLTTFPALMRIDSL